MALYSGNWNPLGNNVFYRKLEVLTLNWCEEYGVNLSDYIVAASPFGGPLALCKEDKKAKNSNAPNYQGDVHLFTPAGNLITTLKDAAKNAVLVTWSDREDLVSVKNDGHITVYDIYGTIKDSFYLDQEIRDTKILVCKEFASPQGTGIGILTTSLRFFTVNNVLDPKIRRFAEVSWLESPPASWTVLAEASKDSQIIIANDSSVYFLGSDTCSPTPHSFSGQYNSIVQICMSRSSNRIAFCSDTGLLWIGIVKRGQMLEKLCEFNTKTKMKPAQMLWAGSEAIVGLWKDVLLAVGIENDYLSYNMETPVFLAEEVDGLRIISHTSHDFLQLVPEVTMNIFRIGSISAGTLLLEASKEFERRTHKADEYIKMLRDRNEVELAVEQCIQAAGHEFASSDQKMLLRAAAFGKCFVPDYNRDDFVNMCQTLRVLNNVREPLIGLPLSYKQLQELTIPVLLDRLILRRQYAVAMKIADYLKTPEETGSLRILGNWAFNKVQQMHLDDEEVARVIYNKLGTSPSISYSDIANEAIQRGRKQLAIRLLDYELRASQQVPLLLLLDQTKKALERAIESGDTQLIYTAIFRIKDSMSAREFTMFVRNFPLAYSMYQKEQDPEKLRDMFYQEDDFNSEAECWMREAYERPEQRFSLLKSALESFRKAKNDFAVSQTDEQIKLLKFQEQFKKTKGIDCMDLSIHKTIEKLLQAKELTLAETLRKEFKVPDKRFWWLKISVLADQNEWIELEKFGKSKKSPIGYEPFVDVCLKAHNRFEAQKYAGRVLEENKIKYMVKVESFEEAAKWALETKDYDGLEYVINKSGPSIKSKLIAMRQQALSRR